MKIQVKNLRPNPFRELKSYPVDRAKIERLKTSISETEFWDNILCRKNNNKKGEYYYEIAYGHHRLIALQELGIKEVNIPVKKITNAQMVKIMAEENLEWLTSPKVVYQTVLAVKEYLDEEITREYKDCDKSIIVLFESEHAYNQAKNKAEGVGRATILKFLGGNWDGNMISLALQAYHMNKDKKLDLKAALTFNTLDQARQFQRAVKRNDVPIEKQKAIAEKVKKNLKEKVTVSGHFRQKQKTIAEDVLNQITPQSIQTQDEKDAKLIRDLVTKIDEQSRTLFNNLLTLRSYMKKMEIVELKGMKVWLAKSAVNQLMKELNRVKEQCKNDKANS